MIGPRIMSVLTGRASQVGEKSNVVSVIIALIGLLLVVMILAVIYKAPTWVIASILAFAIIFCVFFMVIYTYCLLKDPDLLRSERMVLKKMAIERKLVGDSSTGERVEELVEVSNPSSGISQNESFIEGLTEKK